MDAPPAVTWSAPVPKVVAGAIELITMGPPVNVLLATDNPPVVIKEPVPTDVESVFMFICIGAPVIVLP